MIDDSDAQNDSAGPVAPQPDQESSIECREDSSGDSGDTVEYDDRDVRTPRDQHDHLAETDQESRGEPPVEPSMEDEIRHMASEIECEGIPDPGVEQPTAESPPEERALSSTDERETEGSIPDQAGNQASETPHDEGGEVAAKDVAPPVRLNRPGEANSLAAAHEAFSRAIRAHAEAKGLSLIDQTSFLQVLHRPTGQKIYFGLQTKTATVHVETTLPIVGQFGAVAKSDNGKIQAMIDFPVTDGDELTNIISLIDMLASGHFGPLPPARSKKASQPAQ